MSESEASQFTLSSIESQKILSLFCLISLKASVTIVQKINSNGALLQERRGPKDGKAFLVNPHPHLQNFWRGEKKYFCESPNGLADECVLSSNSVFPMKSN